MLDKQNVMKVYILIADYFTDEQHIVGVFSTEEKAHNYRQSLGEECGFRYYIDEWVVDEELKEESINRQYTGPASDCQQ